MKNLFKSLSNFQNECPAIHKGTQGYGYTYAELKDIFNVINPILKKNGLGFYQAVNEGVLKTVVFHIESGETIESNTELKSNVSLKGMNDFQVLGSGITYIRRYSLSALLGIITDKDTDAAGEQAPKESQSKDEEKEWLNPDTPAWNKAVNKGMSLEEVRKYYKVSKSNADMFKHLSAFYKKG